MLKKVFCVGLMAILVALVLSGCAKKTPPVKPVEELLATGEKAWTKEKWATAAKSYGQVRDYYPYHTQVSLAQFRAAEALYKDDKFAEALAAFENFEELHPTDKRLPQVFLRIGQCHFRLSPVIDRDQTETEAAVKALERTQQRFPDTEEAKKAAKLARLAYIKLIRHELYVARWYKKTKAYRSAIGRYQKALSYPEVGFGPRIKAELARTEALAQGQKPPKGKLPPEPKEGREKWWKIWE